MRVTEAPLIIRLPEYARANPEAIKSILVATPAGERIPLARLATVEIIEGPNTIKREWYQRRITIESNIRGRDMGSFVTEAQRKVEQQVQLRQLRRRGRSLDEAVEEADMVRLRPILMTTLDGPKRNRAPKPPTGHHQANHPTSLACPIKTSRGNWTPIELFCSEASTWFSEIIQLLDAA